MLWSGFGLCLVLFLFAKLCSAFHQNDLFFASPEYPIQNPNFTIGALFYLRNGDGSPDYFGITDALTMYCSLRNYANGNGKFPAKGTFNLFAVEEESSLDMQVNALVKRLEAQDLFYIKNGSLLGSVPDTPIGTIFLGARLNELVYFYSPVAQLPIPLITHSAIYNYREDDSFAQENGVQDYGLQVATEPAAFLLASAIGDLLVAFNWTLLGLFYSNDPYGLAGQAAAIDLIAFTQTIAIECSQVYINSTDVSQFASCIKSSSVTSVITLWMPLEQASMVAQEIIDETGLEDELVFIVPYVQQVNIKRYNFPVMTFFFSTLVFESGGDLYVNCLNDFQDNQGSNFIPDSLLEEYFSSAFKCQPQDSSLPPCPEDMSQRTFPCSCTGTEMIVNRYVASNVDMLMEAIYLMQNNCSYLTAQAASFFPNLTTPDYCSLRTFNTSDLAIALKSVQLNGYAGSFLFNRFSTVRTAIDLQLFQVQPTGSELIGAFAQFNLTVNTSLAFFYTNITSEIVADNPAIGNSALAAVGFAVDIALMALTAAVMIFVLIKAKHPVIKKSSPTFCLLILMGILFIELAFLFYCFPATDALCHLDDWFLVTGVALVIANLLAKAYRIYVIFHNRSAQAVKISHWSLFAFSGAILLVTWVMMILYVTLGDGLVAQTIQSSSDRFYRYVICQVQINTFQTLFLISFYVFFVLLFVAAAIFAFLNRKVSSVYGESAAVSMVVYLWIGLAVLYAPIYYVQGGSTDSNQVRYALRFIATSLACFLTLIFLFYPKISRVLIDEYRMAKGHKNK